MSGKAGPLIEGYDLEVTSPPCEPGAERCSAFAHLSRDISGVLPYLNAAWPGAIYDQAAANLAATWHGRRVVLYADRIAVGGLEDREQAAAVLAELVAEINRVWADRGRLQPRFGKRTRPNPLALYRLLPRTNCGACNLGSCFVFANKLATGEVSPEQCPALAREQAAEQRREIEGLLAAAR